MAIKQEYALSRAEFDEALVRLRLNVSEVAKETGIPRSYLSEFRNGDRQIRPEQLAKLKDYFESKGLVFEESSPEPEKHLPVIQQPSQQQAAAPYRFIPVYLDVGQPAVIKTQSVIQDNDARLAVLLQQETSRNDGFMGDGELSQETQDSLQEVFALMSANYALWRSLSGWPALGLSPSGADVETVRDVVFNTFIDQLKSAGLFVEPSENEDPENFQGVAA